MRCVVVWGVWWGVMMQQDGAHHLDLRASNPLDPQSVIDARLQEVAYFKQWLAELELHKSKHASQ